VAVEVVDGFEPVEIDAEHGDGLAAAGGGGEDRDELFVEMGTVGQAGELVVPGEVADALERRFALGDVLADAADGENLTIAIVFGLHVDPEPAIGTVGLVAA
jgi:hypothetical protein